MKFMKSGSKLGQHIFYSIVTSEHQLLLMKKRSPPPLVFHVNSAMRSALNNWKPGRLSGLSGMASLSQVSVKHSAAEFEKSLLMRVRRSTSSVLLRRERRLILGTAVQKYCLGCVASC